MPDKLTNQPEIAPPVELTDEEMEQAAGGYTDYDAKAAGFPFKLEGNIISWKEYPGNWLLPILEPFKCKHCGDPSLTWSARKVTKTQDRCPHRDAATYYGYEDCFCWGCHHQTEHYLLDQ